MEPCSLDVVGGLKEVLLYPRDLPYLHRPYHPVDGERHSICQGDHQMPFDNFRSSEVSLTQAKP